MAATIIAVVLGAVALGLLVRGQHISEVRRARREAQPPAIPHQRQGEK
ncbi:hypothetical protein ACIOUE_00730 [Streptomyces xanthochromogenes]